MHLRTEEVTLAEVLKSGGYNTAHFGKWHLKGISKEYPNQPGPNEQGFDYSYWTDLNAQPSHRNPVNFMRDNKSVGKLTGYACQLVVEDAIRWLDTKWDKTSPFYLNVWFHEPHQKVAAPANLKRRHQYNQDYYGCIENMDRALAGCWKKSTPWN